jgi:MtaA/CmuA family methyltransferase
VHYCAGLAGVSIRDYTTNPQILAECVIRYYERFKPDAIWLSADTWISAGAMGARVGATEDNQPFSGLGQPLVQTASDIDRIPAAHLELGRYPVMLEALTRIKYALGKDVFIVACFDQYPFSLAAALMGINSIMLKLVDDPTFVLALMERALEYAQTYAGALTMAGADLLSGGDSPAGLIGPLLYEQIAWPYEKRLIKEIKQSTDKPVSLHICGNATPYLKLMAGSGADVLELDHQVDLRTACQLGGPKVALWGNLDPVRVLAQGSVAEVQQAARHALATVAAEGHQRFVLSSGCTLAMETPAENLDAMLKMNS